MQVWRTPTPVKETSEKSEEKRYRDTEGETSFPSWAIDALMWEEEQMCGKKEEDTERNREWPYNLATLNHSVASYDQQRSHGKAILLAPCPQEGCIIIIIIIIIKE